MYKYISENNLFSANRSDFRTGYSCINQLLSITHDTYYSFNEGSETRAIIYKLCQHGFSGDLLFV